MVTVACQTRLGLLGMLIMLWSRCVCAFVHRQDWGWRPKQQEALSSISCSLWCLGALHSWRIAHENNVACKSPCRSSEGEQLSSFQCPAVKICVHNFISVSLNASELKGSCRTNKLGEVLKKETLPFCLIKIEWKHFQGEIRKVIVTNALL